VAQKPRTVDSYKKRFQRLMSDITRFQRLMSDFTHACRTIRFKGRVKRDAWKLDRLQSS